MHPSNQSGGAQHQHQQPGYAPQPQYPTYPAQPSYQTVSPDQRQALAQRGQRLMVYGAVLLVIGLGLTLFTFASGSPIVIVAWGPVVFGGYRLVRGWLLYSKNK